METERLIKLNELVFNALKDHKELRGDDFLLIEHIYSSMFDTEKYDFKFVMRNHSELSIPSFESIRRARQRIMEDYPEFKPSDEMIRKRKRERALYREFYGKKR